ncbi:archease [bacterium]|nr:archease [bacterium]MBU4560931.1 archease [bacterium]MCG2677354.1 archease [bacterium]
MKKYKILEHTADVGIEARGETLKEAFANTASGMLSIMIDPEKVGEKESYSLQVKGKDEKELLVAFLSELLYKYEVNDILPKRVDISLLTDKDLKAEVYGEKIDLKRHTIDTQIKAVTYHQLAIEKNKDWKVRVIFDI